MDNEELNSLIENANNGIIAAMNELAARMATGDGIEQNLEGAIQYYYKAGQAGSPEALYNLGLMQLFGEGTKQNNDQGVSTLLQACRLGSSDACIFIAESYTQGLYGLDKSYESALPFYLAGFFLGDAKGANIIGELVESNCIKRELVIHQMKNFSLKTLQTLG